MWHTPSRKPLTLKQRTTSLDSRRDHSSQTWTSLIGLIELHEFFITVNHFSIWKRHLAWAMENGKDMRDYMTQRYSSSMVFMSLLLSTELSVLFSPSETSRDVRDALRNEEHTHLHFWAGFFILISSILTVLGLISSFTAWTLVSAVSENNSRCIFRSSIGQYVVELPGKFIVGSIYTFMIWLVLFFFILLPMGFWSMFLMLLALTLFVHTIAAFSAFGRIIMHSGAMGKNPIFESSFEARLEPRSLHNHILSKARANLWQGTSIRRQYSASVKPISTQFLSEEMLDCFSDSHQSDNSSVCSDEETALPHRKRESMVRFSDGFSTNGERFQIGSIDTSPEAQVNLQSPPLVVSLNPNLSPRSALAAGKNVDQREALGHGVYSEMRITSPLRRSAIPSPQPTLSLRPEHSPKRYYQSPPSPPYITSHEQNHSALLTQLNQLWSGSTSDGSGAPLLAKEENSSSQISKFYASCGNLFDPSTHHNSMGHLPESGVDVKPVANDRSSSPQRAAHRYQAANKVMPNDDIVCDNEKRSLLDRVEPGTYNTISRSAEGTD